jgi:hypothetical protein
MMLLVHYLGATDYPVSGDAAASIFLNSVRLPLTHQQRQADYRIDVIQNTLNI